MRDEFPMVVERPEEHLLTVREVARHLNVSEASVRRWVRLGLLPAIRIGLPNPSSKRPRLMLRFAPGDVARLASAPERRAK